MEWWDYYTRGEDGTVAIPEDTSQEFDFDDGLNKVTGWIDSLANTYGKIQKIRHENVQDEADRRSYEDITQKAAATRNGKSLSTDNIVMVGVGCLALYLIIK